MFVSEKADPTASVFVRTARRRRRSTPTRCSRSSTSSPPASRAWSPPTSPSSTPTARCSPPSARAPPAAGSQDGQTGEYEERRRRARPGDARPGRRRSATPSVTVTAELDYDQTASGPPRRSPPTEDAPPLASSTTTEEYTGAGGAADRRARPGQHRRARAARAGDGHVHASRPRTSPTRSTRVTEVTTAAPGAVAAPVRRGRGRRRGRRAAIDMADLSTRWSRPPPASTPTRGDTSPCSSMAFDTTHGARPPRRRSPPRTPSRRPPSAAQTLIQQARDRRGRAAAGRHRRDRRVARRVARRPAARRSTSASSTLGRGPHDPLGHRGRVRRRAAGAARRPRSRSRPTPLAVKRARDRGARRRAAGRGRRPAARLARGPGGPTLMTATLDRHAEGRAAAHPARPRAAARVMAQLDEAEIEELTAEIVRLERVDQDLADEVLEEFYDVSVDRRPGVGGGLRLRAAPARGLARAASAPPACMERLADLAGRASRSSSSSTPTPARSSRCSRRAPADRSPSCWRTCAPSTRRRSSPACQPDMQADVAHRIALMERASPDVVAVVAENLQRKASAVLTPRRCPPSVACSRSSRSSTAPTRPPRS